MASQHNCISLQSAQRRSIGSKAAVSMSFLSKQPSYFSISLTLFLYCLTGAFSDNDTTFGQLFVEQVMCPGKVIRLDRCPVSMESDGKTKCSLTCAKDSQCVGFLRDAGSGVCYLCSELVSDDCLNNTQDRGSLEAFEKQQKCSHNLSLTTSNRCECDEGMRGDSCQTRMRDCTDWNDQGFSTDGLYWIRPSMEHAAFQIFCGMEFKRSYFMIRNSSSFNFYRGWEEYVNGFGDIASRNHWLGLTKMSLVTNSGATDRCLAIEFILKDFSWYQSIYINTTITDASHNFTIHYSNNTYFNVNNYLGDCLAAVKGQPFSTYDADHDGDVTTNCAARHQSGWWMGTATPGECALCNPTGRLLTPTNMKRTNVPEEVFWTPFGDGNVAPRWVSMWFQRY
ncbi:hypothetical protein V1264_008294 [Littorina saxatilis]